MRRTKTDYYFGQRLNYKSQRLEGLTTPCIFIRDDNGKAVIMFKHAEFVARANYHLLSPYKEVRFGEL